MNSLQRGFTLIEIMITLLLSSVLIAAIGKVFVESKDGFRKQKALSFIVQDGRYAMEILGKEFRHIGFLNNKLKIGGTAENIFTSDNDVLSSDIDFSTGEYIHGDVDASGFDSDVFDINHVIFRYQLKDASDLSASSPNYGSSPCSRGIELTVGEDPEIEDIVVSVYFYVQFDSGTASPSLYCKAKRDNLSDPSKNKTGQATPLISNVEKMYILYGVDTSGDGASNQYLDASQVTLANWKNVVSVRTYLVLGSEDSNVTNKTPSYTIEGTSYAVNLPLDKRFYKVFSSTFAIRN